VHVWRVPLDQPDEVVAAERAHLTPAELTQAGRGDPTVCRRRTLSRAALRSVLGLYLDIPAADVRFSHDRGGKPQVVAPRRSEPLRFSLTHSGDCCLVAAARADIGIDVERIEPKPELQAVAEQHFAAEEAAAIRGAGAGVTSLFFRYWTCKEALIKALGAGLPTMRLDGFVIRFVDEAPVVAACRYADPASLTLALIPVGEPWCAAVAVRRPPSDDSPLRIRLRDHHFSVVSPRQR
jgi:4'-phosphopantetheinyl transferase